MQMPGEKRSPHTKQYRFFLGSARIAIIVLAAILIVFFVIFLSRSAYSLGYEAAAYEPTASESEAEGISVTVKSGMSAREVGQMLIDAGLIDESIEAFLVQDMLSGLHGKYIEGTYSLNASMTVDEILQTICTSREDEDDS